MQRRTRADGPASRSTRIPRRLPARLAVVTAAAWLAASPTGTFAAESGADGQASSATRAFEHAAGTTRIPADPQRIVALNDSNVLAPLLELGAGARVVGSAHDMRDGQPFFRVGPDAETAGITPIGDYHEPDLEKIVALQPDLIVGPDAGPAKANYETLSQIAPTVLVRFDGSIQRYMGQFAELINARDRLAALESRYRSALQEIRDKIDRKPGSIVVSMITAGVYADAGTIYTQANWNPFQQVLKRIGFARPAIQLQDAEIHNISFERLRTQDADLLLLLSFGGDDASPEDAAAPLMDSPLWDRLNAVQKDQAYLVPHRADFAGLDYGTRLAFLDYLRKHLENLDISGDLSHVDIARPGGS